MDRSRKVHVLVEPNNTGDTSDDLSHHDLAARSLVEDSYTTYLATKLKVPLLVPVFPRPEGKPYNYVHYLTRQTLKVDTGKLTRPDLQLVAMIKDAQSLLSKNGIEVESRVLMHGFSASAGFVNRFSVLHPEYVRAIAAGGINGMTILPLTEWKGRKLRYPIGIFDLNELAGIQFNREAYQKVSQYLYMGYLDRNDTLPYNDSWEREDADLIRKVFSEKMMPDRWKKFSDIASEYKLPIQFATYNGTSHKIQREMMDDVARFFEENIRSGKGEFVAIRPFEYPFVEFEVLRKVHIKSADWRGSKAIPSWLSPDLNGAHFIFSIQEWMKGQDYHQMDDFWTAAGFEFVLKANGHPSIRIKAENYGGNVSDGSGNYQGFLVELSKDTLKQIIPGVNYEIIPKGKASDASWVVSPGVYLKRPE